MNPFKPGGMKTGSMNLQFQDLFLSDFKGQPKRPHVTKAPTKPMITMGEVSNSLTEFFNSAILPQDPLRDSAFNSYDQTANSHAGTKSYTDSPHIGHHHSQGSSIGGFYDSLKVAKTC